MLLRPSSQLQTSIAKQPKIVLRVIRLRHYIELRAETIVVGSQSCTILRYGLTSGLTRETLGLQGYVFVVGIFFAKKAIENSTNLRR